MPRFIFCALLFGALAPEVSYGYQTAANLTLGSVSVELRRVNTIFGANNANPLFGTFAPGDTKLFLVQQGTADANPDLPGKVLYINPRLVDGPVGTLLDFQAQLPGVLDIGHFEKGLLGLAFHPDFHNPAMSGYLKFYTYSNENRAAHPPDPFGSPDFIHPETAGDATRVNNLAVLREWTANSVTPTSATPSRVILKIADPQNQHNGGTIAFSPSDGYLYWALGDGGGNSSNSPDFVGSINSNTDGHTNSAMVNGQLLPHGNGQDRTNPLGSILRINPLRAVDAPDANATASANGQYQIPIDNPFTRQANIDPGTGEPYPAWNPAWVEEIYAYGLRNPYRFSFDSGADAADPNRGTLYLADAGYNDREEIDVISAGGNYGWVIREGTDTMQGQQGIPAYTAPPNAKTGLPDTLIDPVAEYHESVGIAIVGGFVYRGSTATTLAGKYILGDWQSPLSPQNGNGLFLYFDTNEAKNPNEPFTIRRLGISPTGAAMPNADLLGFGQGAGGEIYAMFDNGQIYELQPIIISTPGDYNDDGTVDAADYVVWRNNVGTNVLLPNDAIGNTIGPAHYDQWRANFGETDLAAGGGHTIPELATARLLILSIMICLHGLKRRNWLAVKSQDFSR
jgi:glucose/arabinose dehydrogenase